MISNEDLIKIVVEQEQKFDYSFTTLNFGTLALSIQFSPGYGKVAPFLLISAWLAFMISALLAGYRVIYRLVAVKLNYQANRGKEYQTHMGQMLNVKRLDPHRLVTDPFGKPLEMREMESSLVDADEHVRKAMSEYEKLEKRLGRTYWVQMGAFLMGLALNLIFVSINYLCKAT